MWSDPQIIIANLIFKLMVNPIWYELFWIVLYGEGEIRGALQISRTIYPYATKIGRFIEHPHMKNLKFFFLQMSAVF